MRGGKREGAGRKPGSVNKATAEIKSLAQKHGPAAFARIVAISKDEDLRVALPACQEILNRGYGRPPQPQTGEGGEGPVQVRLEVGWLPASTAS